MKTRQWEVSTEKGGPFVFNAENKALAHAHAVQLREDPGFIEYGAVLVSDNIEEPVRHIGVRFVGWVDDD